MTHPARTTPHDPPFAIGERVVYLGNPHSYNDGPTIRHGDVGTVTRNTPGQFGHPELGPRFAEALDGWSSVVFHDDPRTVSAVDQYAVDAGRYKLAPDA